MAALIHVKTIAADVLTGTPAAHADYQVKLSQKLRPRFGHPHNLKVIGSNPIPANLRGVGKTLTSSADSGSIALFLV